MGLRAILDGLRGIAVTTAGLGSNRLELIGIELQEELERQTGNLVWLLLALGFGALAVLLASVLLLIVFWDSHRVMVALTLVLAYALLSGWCILCLQRRLRHAPQPFALTIEEFRRDQAALLGRSVKANEQTQG